MNLKKQKQFAVLWLVLGIVLWIVFTAINIGDFKSGMLSGMGTCFLVIGTVRLVRLRRIEKDPDRAADYEAAMTDERVVYIANKARSLTFAISVIGELIAGLVAIYVFDDHTLGQAFCYLCCGQCLLFTVIYRIYAKKY